MENIPLLEAGIGQPFLLHVIVTDTDNGAQYPVIKNIENLHIRQSGFQMNMVNNTTSVTYQYRIRIDTPGTYTIGPAQITQANGIVESQPVTITVGQEQKTTLPKKSAGTAQTASFLRLVCNKDKVVVGEKVCCTLTFYTTDPAITLQALTEPDKQDTIGFTIKHKEGAITGTQKINDVEHRYAQWQWDVYPIKSGTCIIPAYAADYTTQSHNQMMSFFFGRNDVKRTYSNTMRITVDPLPAHQASSKLVGVIQDFTAKIEPANARIGEGIVLTLTLMGDADFEVMPLITLAQMPEGLKWYDSKHYDQPSKTDKTMTTHSMEYIIQALQLGTYTIPSQSITYFDTKERAYKTRKTIPLALHITPDAAAVHTKKKDEPIASAINTPEPDTILPIAQTGPWIAQSNFSIPWYLYWIALIVFTIVWLAFVFITSQRKWLTERIWHWKKDNSIYAVARKKIKLAQKKHDASSFYTIFTTFLTAYFGLEPAQLSPEIIDQKLAETGLSKQAIDDWRLFFAQVSQASFYQEEYSATFFNQLAEKSLYWIDIFEKLTRGNQ